MIICFGGLVFLSVGGVLALTVATNFKNTFSLLNRSANQLVSHMENSIGAEVGQVEFALEGLRRLYSDGEVAGASDPRWASALRSVLRTVRVVESLSVVDTEGSRVGYLRTPQGAIRSVRAPQNQEGNVSWVSNEQTNSANPKWIESENRGNVNFHRARIFMSKHQTPTVAVTASIGGWSLNRIASSIARETDATAFILDNNNRLVAYSKQPKLLRGVAGLELSEVPDTALNNFLQAEPLANPVSGDGPSKGHEVSRTGHGEEFFVAVTKEITLFSMQPYTVGVYFPETDVNSEVTAAGRSGIAGAFALISALALSVFLSSRMTGPMRKIAGAARQFSQLELDSFQPLPPSRVREVDAQSSSINSMHHALTEFRRYVPQKLVQRIITSGTEVTRPVERQLTIMFTDIADFTARSENMSAAETVSILNEHFELVSNAVSKSEGTVDKYLGDGVMAFWGAPEVDEDHARHAVDAALAIRLAHQRYLTSLTNKDSDRLHLRIGLHTGRATVGNIGGSDRVNYTVTGHAVNIANRLEQLTKRICKGDETAISISEECFEAAGRPPEFRPAGLHDVRGSSRLINVYTLQENAQTDTLADGVSSAV